MVACICHLRAEEVETSVTGACWTASLAYPESPRSVRDSASIAWWDWEMVVINSAGLAVVGTGVRVPHPRNKEVSLQSKCLCPSSEGAGDKKSFPGACWLPA